MKRIVLISSIIVSISGLFAQQESQFATVNQNPYLLNPAAGGLYNVAQFDLNTRMQWVGYGQGPTTISATGHSQIKVGKSGQNQEFNTKDQVLFANPKMSVGSMKHIVGGKILNDAIGPFSKTTVQGSYAVHLPLSKKLNIGVGLGLGLTNFKINQSRVVLTDENDIAYDAFLGNSSSQSIGDVNAGFVLYGNGLFVGLSSAQILRNKAQFADVLTNSVYNRHYYLNLRYGISFGNITVEPAAVVKYAESSPLSADLGARFFYNNASWIGIYGRTSNSLVFQVGSNLIKNIYFSYSYEHAIGKITNAATGTHEIHLGYYLGKNRNIESEMK